MNQRGVIKVLYAQPGIQVRASTEILEASLIAGLPSMAFTVIVTSNSFKALEYTEDIHFDVIMLHLDLVTISGVELMRVMRLGGCTVPMILLVEPKDEAVVLSERDKSHFSQLLVVPYTSQSIATAICTALGTDYAYPPSVLADDWNDDLVVLFGTTATIEMTELDDAIGMDAESYLDIREDDNETDGVQMEVHSHVVGKSAGPAKKKARVNK